MSLYFFRIGHGNLAGVSDTAFDLLDRDAAWEQMTTTSSNLVAGICRNLKPQSDWRMELLDDSGKPQTPKSVLWRRRSIKMEMRTSRNRVLKPGTVDLGGIDQTL